MKNKWLNKENINYKDKIIDVDLALMFTKDVIEYDMTIEQLQEFKSIMSNLSNDSTRCITVFRDAVMTDTDIYNICLSCGDIEWNGERYSTHGENLKRLSDLKKEILKNY